MKGLEVFADKDKEKQLNFVFLSTVMVKSVKVFGYNKQTLYVSSQVYFSVGIC